jgi:hypothetical protein
MHHANVYVHVESLEDRDQIGPAYSRKPKLSLLKRVGWRVLGSEHSNLSAVSESVRILVGMIKNYSRLRIDRCVSR